MGLHLRHALLVIFILTGGSNVVAQGDLCQGSFGDNIFESGSFGSGGVNILPDDPGYAPGYIYTANVPPGDGYYTITNSTFNWPDIYGTWLLTGDNSADQYGYMMVVNASFSPGIFYEQIVENLCENTLYEFSADVLNMIKKDVPDHILPNVSFLIDDETRFTSGPIQQTETWLTAGFTFRTEPGQTSVKLTLRNNAPGGIGNDLALDNITFKPCGPFLEVYTSEPDGIVCEDQGFPLLRAELTADSGWVQQWQFSPDGETWSSIPGAQDTFYQIEPLPPGLYWYRLLYAASSDNLMNSYCRIASERFSVQVVPIEYFIADTICDGLTYQLGEEELSESGSYQATFISSQGCDSIVTLDLTVVPDPDLAPEFVVTMPSCRGYNDGQIMVVVPGDAVPPVFVAFDNGSPGGNLTFSGPAGRHEVYLVDRYGCSFRGEVSIPEKNEFVLTGISDTVVDLGYSVQIAQVANDTVAFVEWNPATGLSCTNCLDPFAGPADDQNYIVTAVSIDGCEASKEVLVRVNREIRSFAPNVFSPNSDGINDYWGIYADAGNVKSIKQVVICDRWGGILYDGRDLSPEYASRIWDGRSGGLNAPAGVYTFIARLQLADDSELVKSGNITIIR